MGKIVVRCPEADCGANYSIDEAQLGRKARCKRCQSIFILSRSSNESFQSESQNRHYKNEDQVPAVWQPGDVILDRYEVKQVLGKGGFGTVYLVHHAGWNTDLAVKCPQPDKFVTKTSVENFERECETWVNLGLHPHIVSCYYVRRLGGIPRVFAEYVEGGNLHDWIRTGTLYESDPEQALERILDIAIQFAWGLHYAHEQGLIHQDVKPANLMMTPDGTAKVTDFGLAKARTVAGEVAGAKGQSILVSSGGMTPAYCSPEQANRQPLSLKTDIWSWAVSLLEMFTAEVSWPSGSVAGEALEGYLEMGAGDERVPRMPPQIAKLLRHCFQMNPHARPANMLATLTPLKEICHEITGSTYRRKAPKPAEFLADSLNNRAVSLLDLDKEKNEAAAEKLWKNALRADRHHPESTYNLGLIQWRSARISDDVLVKQLQEVTSSHPDQWICTYALSLIHLERGDCEKAIQVLKKIQQENKARAEVAGSLLIAKNQLPSSRRCLQTINSGAKSVCLSADGRHVLVGNSWPETTLELWDLSTGSRIRTFSGHADEVRSVCISDNGRFAISGSNDHTMRLWDVATGKCLGTFTGHTNSVHSVCISPDGNQALSGSNDLTAKLWDLATGRCIRTFQDVIEPALSRDGRFFASSQPGIEEMKTLVQWDLLSGRRLHIFQGHDANVNSICISNDGRFVLSGSSDKTVRLWSIPTGKCVRTLLGHNEDVTSVSLTRDARYAVSGSWDGTIRLWSLSSGRCLWTFQLPFDGSRRSNSAVTLRRDGKIAVSAHTTGLRVWQIHSDQTAVTAPLLVSRPLTNVSSGQDIFGEEIELTKMALGKADWSIAANHLRKARSQPGCQRRPDALDLWANLYTRLPRKSFEGAWQVQSCKGNKEGVRSLCLSWDGQFALSSAFDKTLRLWEVCTGKCIRSFETQNGYQVSLSNNGRYAIALDEFDSLQVWDIAKGCCVRTIDNKNVKSAVFTSDDRMVLLGKIIDHGEYQLQWWDINAGHCVHTLEFPDYPLIHLSFDERYVVTPSSSDSDPTVNLWDIATGHKLRTFAGHERRVVDSPLRISLSGRYIFTGGLDNTIKMWEVASGRCMRTFHGHQGNVTAICVCADDRFFLSGSADNTIRIWEVATGRCLRIIQAHAHGVSSLCLSKDGRFALSATWNEPDIKVWFLDWELNEDRSGVWDEGVRPYLTVFLTLRTPETRRALTRQGKPKWTEEDFQGLLHMLGCAGYGWLRPEVVRRELEQMAANWKEPPPLA